VPNAPDNLVERGGFEQIEQLIRELLQEADGQREAGPPD
jgi:hypothetical protein